MFSSENNRGKTKHTIYSAVSDILYGENASDVVNSLLDERNKDTFRGARAPVKRWLSKHKDIQALSLSNIKRAGVGIFGGLFRNRKVKKYREMLFRKHHAEINREASKAINAVMRHESSISEFILSLRGADPSSTDVIQPPINDLGAQYFRDRKKLFVNSSTLPGPKWSKFDAKMWAEETIIHCSSVSSDFRKPFSDELNLFITPAYADYVFNKYEEDKSKYVY